MSNKPIIYITYPGEGAADGWMQKFTDNLKFAADKIIKHDFEYRIRGIDFDEISPKVKLNGKELWVIILPVSLSKNESYFHELDSLCEILPIHGNKEFQLPRVFKILLSPNENIFQPDSLKYLTGYNFFEYAERKNTLTVFDFDTQNMKSWSRILDLVYDMNDILTSDTGGNRLPEEHFVYLGGCSGDQINNRDDLRRELQHFGLRILPVTELPHEKALIEEIVRKNLARCNFIVQILGEQHGPMSAEGKTSIFDIENQTIRNFLKQNTAKRQFIWIPTGMKISESKQELYVSRVKRDDSTSQSQVIEATSGEFKGIIAQHIKSGREEAISKSESDAYIISMPGTNTDEIELLAGKFNINLKKFYILGNVISYQEHLKLLESIDNILVYCHKSDEAWLRSKIGDAVKAMGMGRNNPYKQFLIVSKSKVDLEEFNSWLEQIKNITEDDVNGLTHFFKNIKE